MTEPGPPPGDGPERPPEPDAREEAPADWLPEDPGALVCEICGSAMYEQHCKILCPTCGYQRDCSDP